MKFEMVEKSKEMYVRTICVDAWIGFVFRFQNEAEMKERFVFFVMFCFRNSAIPVLVFNFFAFQEKPMAGCRMVRCVFVFDFFSVTRMSIFWGVLFHRYLGAFVFFLVSI